MLLVSAQNKIILKTILITGLLLMVGALSPLTVFAKTCEEDFLNASPAGEVPTTDSGQISNCQSISSRTGTAVTDLSCNVKIYNYTVKFCDAGTQSVSTATGEIILYVEGNYWGVRNDTTNKSFTGSGQKSNVSTGVNIKVGDYYHVLYGESTGYLGNGWRSYNGTDRGFFTNSINDATARGYTIIAKQFWADDETSSRFDSHDFDDVAIVVAVKKNECKDSDINLSSVPSSLSHLMLGSNISLTRTGTTSLADYKLYTNDVSVSGAFGCNLSSLDGTAQTKTVDCTIDKKPAYPNTTVTWTHKWCNTETGNCLGKKICSKTLTIDVDPYGAYMRTDLGNSYIKGDTTIPKFPIDPLSQRFSTFNFSTNGTSSPFGHSWLSFKNYLLLNYSDSNGREDFYNYIKNLIGVLAKTTTKPSSQTLSNSNYASFVSNYDVIEVNGNLTLSSATCSTKTIFFVTGDLIVDSNFDINGDNACLFIVDGETRVNPNVSLFKAFVITDDFSSGLSANQLKLIGGLIVQSGNTFNRNINLLVTNASSIQKTVPSEIISYEGARYIKLLGSLLNEPTRLSIREIQYSGNTF
jgi:hypothetical protein